MAEENKGTATQTEPVLFDLNLGEDTTTVVETKLPDVTTVAPVVNTSKFDVSAFKEFDPEISEDNFTERVSKRLKSAKELEDKYSDLELVAAGRDLIDNNENIAQRSSLLKLDDDNLFYADAVYQYMTVNKMSEKDAVEKATKKLNDLKEKNPYAIEEKALKLRADLDGQNKLEIQNLIAKQKDAREKLKSNQVASPTSSNDKVLEAIDKAEKLFDMEFPKEHKAQVDEKIKGPAKKYIESGDFAKDMADPQVMAEFALFRANKKKVFENFARKQVVKSKVPQHNINIPRTPYSPPSGVKPSTGYR